LHDLVYVSAYSPTTAQVVQVDAFKNSPAFPVQLVQVVALALQVTHGAVHDTH
jgi:hypothetical protein